ncbi:MAG: rhomboid family intramembrane serine protease [Cyanobacteria bacterium SID2]|nr:rhomboid family intramembrane serine protease [Cyanobacteria bacterium SID2]MBP0003052.1 rhomboid family intramembrane serine protease [Cyanobacteria bacterium SBC]
MTIDRLLLWVVFLSCGAFLLRSISERPRQWGWSIVSGGILAITGLLLVVRPQLAAGVGGTLWMVFVLFPILGLRRVNALFREERYQAASQLATAIAGLHPADGWFDRVGVLRALSVAKGGDIEKARSMLKPYQTPKTALGRSAIILDYWMRGAWDELLQWLSSRPERNSDPNLIVYYLRCLGETGKINKLLQFLPSIEKPLRKAGDLDRLYQARLYALAFSGETEQVYRLFEGDLSNYSVAKQQFWMATVQMVAGRTRQAQQILGALRKTCDPVLQRSIDWRLDRTQVDLQTHLTEYSAQVLSALKVQLSQEARYTGRIVGKTVVATWTLIGLNAAMFFLELRAGGSDNLFVLYRLGALIPELVWEGEWWRLLTATFLHFGVSHLVMNMFGLYVLGQFVESRIGIRRFLTTYFVSGIGSMGFITLLALRGGETQFVVGASGAVMGLIGAVAAIFWQGWRQEKAQIAKDRLRAILFVIVIQTIFDLSIPEICFLCHASGAVLGFITASFLLWRKS